MTFSFGLCTGKGKSNFPKMSKHSCNCLLLPEPASVRSRKRNSPLKEGFRNASSDRRPRPPGSAMGKHTDLQQTHLLLWSNQSHWQFAYCLDSCALRSTWVVGPVWQRDRADPAECGGAPPQFQLSPGRAAGRQSHPPAPGCPTPATTNTDRENANGSV